MIGREIRPTEEFLAACAAYGIEFEAGEVDRLGAFLGMLLETNRRFNLTAIAEPAEAWRRHIFDGLTLLPFLAQAGAQRVIDVGSGGGLPGIPLAIVLPDVEFTLLESTGKKARFLEDVAAMLELDHVVIINDRAETLGHDHHHHREQYDIVTARAVGRLPVLLEITIPFAKVGGHVLAIKGEQAAEEIDESTNALHALHAAVVDQHRTPTGTIVVVQKLQKTPRLYPRRPGEPKRVPL